MTPAMAMAYRSGMADAYKTAIITKPRRFRIPAQAGFDLRLDHSHAYA